MAIRKLTLEEWFLKHQLKSIHRRHFHLPVEVTADIRRVADEYQRKHGGQVPYTALLIKALALTGKSHPWINRMVFSTFYGMRMVDFETRSVNVPIVIDADGKPHLSAIVVPNADDLSLADIKRKISEGLKRKIDDLPIGRFVMRKRNTFFNRLALRLLHFVVYNFPKIYVRKGGGGLTVSSLLNYQQPGLDVRPYAYGSTALTICSSSVVEGTSGELKIKIGLGFDHYACTGSDMMSAVKGLSEILQAETPGALEQLTQ